MKQKLIDQLRHELLQWVTYFTDGFLISLNIVEYESHSVIQATPTSYKRMKNMERGQLSNKHASVHYMPKITTPCIVMTD